MGNARHPTHIYVIQFLIVIFLSFFMYDHFVKNNQINDKILQNIRTADSLRNEINVYKQKYQTLLIMANKLDSTISVHEKTIAELKNRKPPEPPQTPKITELDSAVKFIRKFIRE